MRTLKVVATLSKIHKKFKKKKLSASDITFVGGTEDEVMAKADIKSQEPNGHLALLVIAKPD